MPLVVWKLDRLGRNLADWAQLIAKIEQRKIHFDSHAELFDRSTLLLKPVMLLDPQVRLVIEKAIENMRRNPHCCVDDFGMEGAYWSEM
jgi:DNA invertase Pin-like site-specific DNA recombinase